jgi:hypothetical protein
MEQQEITVYAAITISGPLVYHLIRWNVEITIQNDGKTSDIASDWSKFRPNSHN